MKLSRNTQKGQSLFEILFAMAIMAMIGVAIVSLSVTSVRNNVYSNNKTLANKYALEALEWVRAERDDSFHTIWTRGNNSFPVAFCFPDFDDSWGDGSVGLNQEDDDPLDACDDSDFMTDNDNFYRVIIIERYDYDDDEYYDGNPYESLRTKILVRWTDAQGIHEAEAKTYLTNWKNSI